MITYPLNMLESGQYYHIYNRGINSCKIFRSEKDYDHFLSLHKKYIDLIGDTIAYCLLPNHFHFLIKIKEENEIGFVDLSKRPSSKEKWLTIENPENKISNHKNLHRLEPSRQFSHLFNTHSKYFNKKYKRTGSLFEKNFHRIKIDTESYIRQLVLYIHFNPLKHCIFSNISNYPWSSYFYMERNKGSEIQKRMIEDYFGGFKNFILCHKGELPSNSDEDLFMDESSSA